MSATGPCAVDLLVELSGAVFRDFWRYGVAIGLWTPNFAGILSPATLCNIHSIFFLSATVMWPPLSSHQYTQTETACYFVFLTMKPWAKVTLFPVRASVNHFATATRKATNTVLSQRFSMLCLHVPHFLCYHLNPLDFHASSRILFSAWSIHDIFFSSEVLFDLLYFIFPRFLFVVFLSLYWTFKPYRI